MVDFLSKKKRSRLMAAITSKGNLSTEMTVLKKLKERGLIGWRRHWPVLGRPDFAWPKLKIALFVDGCFWHGCSCRRAPKSNIEFWDQKIQRNRKRDNIVTNGLKKRRWLVFRIRECNLKKNSVLNHIYRRIKATQAKKRIYAQNRIKTLSKYFPGRGKWQGERRGSNRFNENGN